MSESEYWLLCSLQTRDREICESFVDAHYAGLFRWFKWLTNDSDWSADLTQETLLAFWESLGGGRGDTSAKIWLLSVGRNVWRNSCRTRSRSLSVSASESDELAVCEWNGTDPVATAIHSECADDVRGAVAELPDEYREAVTLRYWQALSYGEIAQVLAISEELARWRVFQGRQRLRSRLALWAHREEEVT